MFEWLTKTLLLRLSAATREAEPPACPPAPPPATDDEIYRRAFLALDPHGADEVGLVLAGGQLNRPWLLAAYHRGVFPWPYDTRRGMRLAWFSPDPRAVLPLERVHFSRRLLRRLRQRQWRITCDTAFEQVIAHCATVDRGRAAGTWITPELAAAYVMLHRAGIAHSVEAWNGGDLVAGVYGVAFGAYFAGESMFHFESDASKAAIAGLISRLRRQGFQLFDIQQQSPHMQRMGAIEVPRQQFLSLHGQAIREDVSFGPAGEC